MASPIEMHFDTARELLDFVSPLNPVWDAGTHIFRGQPSDQYKLTPSVCRRGAGSFAHGSPFRMFSTSTSDQVCFEIEVLRRFLEGCDKSGLVVPGYSERTKTKIMGNPGQYVSPEKPWPPRELYEIMAAAQHYDVPTRLLDWTERSFVACYFAASSANFELSNMNERIAIWALDTSASKSWKTVEIIRTPGGTSRNQAAQSGLFTTHKVREPSFDDLYQTEALDELEEILQAPLGGGALTRMTLPVSEAPKLLGLCSKLGVDASTLFPGYHGVAKSVRDWANVEVGIRPSQTLMDEYNQDSYDPDFH